LGWRRDLGDRQSELCSLIGCSLVVIAGLLRCLASGSAPRPPMRSPRYVRSGLREGWRNPYRKGSAKG
jgi:hypothetical protein